MPSPQGAQGNGEQAIPKRQQVIAVVQNDSRVESRAEHLAQALEAAEVAFADGTPRLDFNAGMAGTELQNYVHFIPVLVARESIGSSGS